MKSLFAQNLVSHFENSRCFFLVITDVRGRVVYFNSLFENRSGCGSKQQSSFFFADIIAEAEKAKCNTTIRECLRQPDTTSVTSLSCIRQDGSFLHIRWEVSVLLNNNNHPEAIQWMGVEECSNNGTQINTKDSFQQNEWRDEEIQKQKQLLQATIDVQEKERREIGRELHDNISQHLTTTRLYLEVAQEKTDGEALKMIQHAHKGLMDIIAEIRQLSQSLIPSSLSDIGLVASVQDLCTTLENTHTFSMEFQHERFNESRLPENMKLMLFRITQEQINNIIRHANAGSAKISLQTDNYRVTLGIADNGDGFDLKTVKKGLGLDNIRNRASLFGGRLRIDTSPGKGCFIEVSIPL